MWNLGSMLTMAARTRGPAPAIHAGSETISWEALDRASNRVANALIRAGVHPGDVVALSCLTNPWFPTAYYGIVKTGAIAAPLNPLLNTDDAAQCLRHAQAVAHLCQPHLAAASAGSRALCRLELPSAGGPHAGPPGWAERESAGFEPVPLPADAPAALLFTSGSTGRPKAALLTHASLMLNARIYAGALRMTPADRVLIALPLYHSLAQTGLLHPAVCAGAAMVLLERYTPATLIEAAATHAATFLGGVPTMYYDLHTAADDAARNAFAHCRGGLCAGAPATTALLDAVAQRLGLFMLVGYGMTELSAVSLNPWDAPPPRPGSIGWPIWGVEMAILDEEGHRAPPATAGHLAVRGHGVMRGYWNDPEATARAIRGGWFHTGDRAIEHGDGSFELIGRSKEIIIRAGHNVLPAAIEERLAQHPDILQCAVAGVPDPRYGEEVAAYVVLKPGARTTAADIAAWARAKMPAQEYPRIVHLRRELPIGPTGKILRAALNQPEPPA